MPLPHSCITKSDTIKLDRSPLIRCVSRNQVLCYISLTKGLTCFNLQLVQNCTKFFWLNLHDIAESFKKKKGGTSCLGLIFSWTHHDDMSNWWSPNISCSYKTPVRSRMADHDCQGNLRCDVCNATFVSIRSMKRHMIDQHRSNQATCHICMKVFKNERLRRTHLKMLHTETKDYVCSKCGREYKWCSARNKHEKNCIGREPDRFDKMVLKFLKE